MRIENVWRANKVYCGRCVNGEWNPVPFVSSRCHCGCEREGSDIKRDGKVSCFIICHIIFSSSFLGKKSKVAFRTWQLHFLHHPRYTHVRKIIKTLSYVSRTKTSPLVFCHEYSLLFTVTLSADYIDLHCCDFLLKGSYFSTESAKFGEEDLEKKIKIFKLIVEILKAFPVQIRIRLQTNCSIFLESKYSVHAVHSSPLQRLQFFTWYIMWQRLTNEITPSCSSLSHVREPTRKCWRGKNPSISWGIFKLLAVFINLAVMGWFNLLTKRFIVPSCDEIEAKIPSTWVHARCRILEF